MRECFRLNPFAIINLRCWSFCNFPHVKYLVSENLLLILNVDWVLCETEKGFVCKIPQDMCNRNILIWNLATTNKQKKNKKFSPEFFAKNYGIYEVTYKSYAVMNKRFQKIYCKFKWKLRREFYQKKLCRFWMRARKKSAMKRLFYLKSKFMF